MSEPDMDMTLYGFRKRLRYRYISVTEGGEIICKEVAFFADMIRCGTCNTDRYVWLRPDRTGVFKTCKHCGNTTGPISRSEGREIKVSKIPLNEAVQILKGRNSSRRTIGALVRKVRKSRRAPEKATERRELPEEVF